MKRTLILALGITILSVPVLHAGSDQRIGEQPNRESVVQQVNAVTILNFRTDKAISEMRLTMDGKQVDADTVQTTEMGLWLAIVPVNDRLELHAKAGEQNHLLSAKWPILMDSMTLEKKSYGPGKQLKLEGWIEVLNITRITIQGDVRGVLKLEIK